MSSSAGSPDRRIAEGIIELARAIGLSVIAEGVETREQSDWLRSVGCPHQQGWCFARAMPIEELIAWRPAEAIDATAVPSGAG